MRHSVNNRRGGPGRPRRSGRADGRTHAAGDVPEGKADVATDVPETTPVLLDGAEVLLAQMTEAQGKMYAAQWSVSGARQLAIDHLCVMCDSNPELIQYVIRELMQRVPHLFSSGMLLQPCQLPYSLHDRAGEGKTTAPPSPCAAGEGSPATLAAGHVAVIHGCESWSNAAALLEELCSAGLVWGRDIIFISANVGNERRKTDSHKVFFVGLSSPECKGRLVEALKMRRQSTRVGTAKVQDTEHYRRLDAGLFFDQNPGSTSAKKVTISLDGSAVLGATDSTPDPAAARQAFAPVTHLASLSYEEAKFWPPVERPQQPPVVAAPLSPPGAWALERDHGEIDARSPDQLELDVLAALLRNDACDDIDATTDADRRSARDPSPNAEVLVETPLSDREFETVFAAAVQASLPEAGSLASGVSPSSRRSPARRQPLAQQQSGRKPFPPGRVARTTTAHTGSPADG